MKLVRLDNDAAGADPALALRLIEAIGAPDFATQLMAALGAALPSSHCTVFALRNNGRVDAISSASAIGEVATMTAIEYLRRGFDRQDSNMLWLARRKPRKASQLWLGHQMAEEVADERYRRLCYGDTGIRERLSLLALLPSGLRFAVSLYRNHAHPDYAPREFDWIARQSPLITATVMRHVVTTPASALPRDHQQIVAALSARERELISHVIAGRTTKEAAREMGVSLTTALTYRYRAFQHMGIRNHRELIALVGSAA